MPQVEIKISEKTYNNLLALKNRRSFAHGRISENEVLSKIEVIKKDIFGHGSDATPQEIDGSLQGKTRTEIEELSNRFQTALNRLFESGLDFEPEYTMDSHINRMIELIEGGDDPDASIF
jgi:hypothetical protein